MWVWGGGEAGGCFCVASLFVKPCQHKTFCSQPKQILKSDRAYLATLNSSNQPSPPLPTLTLICLPDSLPKPTTCSHYAGTEDILDPPFIVIFNPPPPPPPHHPLTVLFYIHHELESVIVDLMCYYESALTG